MLSIPFVLENDSNKPVRSRHGDAGYDLCSREAVVLKPFERALIPTGVHIELPEGYAGLVLPRSGLAIKKGLSLVNAPGLIDSNFRGEIQAIAINLDPKSDIKINPGERIAQLIIQKVEDADFATAGSLSSTNRNEAGFGSSGVQAL